MDIKTFCKKFLIPILIVGAILKFVIELFSNSGVTRKLEEREKSVSDNNVKDLEKEIFVKAEKQAEAVAKLNTNLGDISSINSNARQRRVERESEEIETVPLPGEADNESKSI